LLDLIKNSELFRDPEALKEAQKKARKLIVGANIMFKGRYGNTLLHSAASYNNLEIAKLLLKHYLVNVNAKNNDGDTPLHLAVIEKHSEMVRLLAKKKRGTGLEIKNEEGYTALHLAAQEAPLAVVESLLSACNRDVNVDVKDNGNGYTALHWAVNRNRPEIVKLLLGQGAIEIDAQDKNGSTPLHVAIHSSLAFIDIQDANDEIKDKNLEIIKLLLASGARVDIPDEYKHMVLDLVNVRPKAISPEIIELVNSQIERQQRTRELFELIFSKFGELSEEEINKIKELIDKGVNINAKNKDGGYKFFNHTLLHAIIPWMELAENLAENNNKCLEIFKLLLDQENVDVNVKIFDRNFFNIGGITPLAWATVWWYRNIEKYDFNTIRALIDKGAAWNDGKNEILDFAWHAICKAISYDDPNLLEAVFKNTKYLIAQGACVSKYCNNPEWLRYLLRLYPDKQQVSQVIERFLGLIKEKNAILEDEEDYD
jgi:ankyrin repeat protein